MTRTVLKPTPHNVASSNFAAVNGLSGTRTCKSNCRTPRLHAPRRKRQTGARRVLRFGPRRCGHECSSVHETVKSSSGCGDGRFSVPSFPQRSCQPSINTARLFGTESGRAVKQLQGGAFVTGAGHFAGNSVNEGRNHRECNCPLRSVTPIRRQSRGHSTMQKMSDA